MHKMEDSVRGKKLSKRELEEELELLDEAVAEYEVVTTRELEELDTAIELYISRDKEISLIDKNKRGIEETFNTAMRAFSDTSSSGQELALKGLVEKERHELLAKWQTIYDNQWYHSDHQKNLERSRNAMEMVQQRYKVARRCLENLARTHKQLKQEKITIQELEKLDVYQPLAEYLTKLESNSGGDDRIVIVGPELLRAASDRTYL